MGASSQGKNQAWNKTFLFLGLVLAVYTVAFVLSRRMSSMEEAEVLSLGVAVDLVLLVPVVLYFLVVRARGLSPLAMAPVFLLSLIAAYQVLPSNYHSPLKWFELVIFPFEIGLLGWLGWRATKGANKVRHSGEDAYVQMQQLSESLVGNKRVAAFLTAELAVFYYALFSWRSKPHSARSATAITHHLESGHGGIVFGFVMILAIEGFAVHMLLHKWNPVVAWIFTLSSLYGVLWMIADYRATVLRPLLFDDDHILFRAGLRYTIQVPKSQIASLNCEKPTMKKGAQSLTLINAPTHWVTLREPMVAEGPYGMRRSVSAIGFTPDQTVPA